MKCNREIIKDVKAIYSDTEKSIKFEGLFACGYVYLDVEFANKRKFSNFIPNILIGLFVAFVLGAFFDEIIGFGIFLITLIITFHIYLTVLSMPLTAGVFIIGAAISVFVSIVITFLALKFISFLYFVLGFYLAS